jgi:hypothetical protein
MPTTRPNPSSIGDVLNKIRETRKIIECLSHESSEPGEDRQIRQLVTESGLLLAELKTLRERVSPIRFGSIGITLGRSDSIAKFFAFSFSNQGKSLLSELNAAPFYGSGVYAIYYHGKCETAYQPLSETETPIYVGKANPANPQAETVEEQGQALWKRLSEHSKNIAKTNLDLADFRYRASPIQTGMQAAVEDFMIRLFQPIWNKEIKICFGIGKHGDSAKTRANKRSPWDTMHPGRRWAEDTTADQMKRSDIETRIREHLQANPPISDHNDLYKLLSLE